MSWLLRFRGRIDKRFSLNTEWQARIPVTLILLYIRLYRAVKLIKKQEIPKLNNNKKHNKNNAIVGEIIQHD
ncbi:MAG: hypothetical protein COB74_07670 [Shewanella sp.]|nr:MAG: hypothetical protein COB74_07670 [Shewanella sp.]